MKNNNLIFNDFYCVECGRKGIPIVRQIGKERESGHLKKLYCLYCGKETNHAEVTGKYTKEQFQKEFELGRFVNGKRIEGTDLISCTKSECDYNISGKCWNCNNSFNCSHRIILENKDKEETNHLLQKGW